MLRTLIVAGVMLMTIAASNASEKHAGNHQPNPQHRVDQASDQKSSRQRVIDAAQVYCQGGTPFDKVHGYLQAFWQDEPDTAEQRKVTCKLH